MFGEISIKSREELLSSSSSSPLFSSLLPLLNPSSDEEEPQLVTEWIQLFFKVVDHLLLRGEVPTLLLEVSLAG